MIDSIVNLDLNILEWVYNNLRCPVLDFFFSTFTHVADKGILFIIIAIILIIIPKTRKTGMMMGGALLIGVILCNVIVKNAVGRERPFDLIYRLRGIDFDTIIPRIYDGSFPSGHTTCCFEVTGVLLYRNRKWGIISLIVAIIVSFSRLYLCMHNPSDIIGGMILGTVCAVLSIILINYVYKKFAKNDYLKMPWDKKLRKSER